MIPVTIIKNNQIKDIGINENQVCSFEEIEILHPTLNIIKATEVRMSNGDQWIVINPPYEEWQIDLCVS
jgi:hypothetical protein